jgi:hypothetical protein
MSLLINFARAHLSALAEAGEINQKKYNKCPTTAFFTEHADKRQRFANWGAQVAASVNGGPATSNGSTPSCSLCGRHHSLDQCRGVQNLIAQHKQKQLDRAGTTMIKPYCRGGSTRHFKKPTLFGGRGKYATTLAAGVGSGVEAAKDSMVAGVEGAQPFCTGEIPACTSKGEVLSPIMPLATTLTVFRCAPSRRRKTMPFSPLCKRTVRLPTLLELP